jgi:hypothetical protein
MATVEKKEVVKEEHYGGRKIEYEFGGPIGVTALMIWSHYILFYFWYAAQ